MRKRNFKRREQRNDYNYKKGDKNNELYNLFSIAGKNILPPFLMALIIELFLNVLKHIVYELKITLLSST